MPDLLSASEILVGEREHRNLKMLALCGHSHTPEVADFLLWELDRATLLPDDAVPADVARTGSWVTFDFDSTRCRGFLTYTEEANEVGDISIMSYLGAALLGLRPGGSLIWLNELGERTSVSLIDVSRSSGVPAKGA